MAGCPSPQSSSSSSSPRINAVSAPPLLRAITEQQSMEEREAADYQLQTTSGRGDDELEYDGVSSPLTDDNEINSQLEWSYVDYMKAAGLQPGDLLKDGDSGSDTSVEAEDDRIVLIKHPSTSRDHSTGGSAIPSSASRTSKPAASRGAAVRGRGSQLEPPESDDVEEDLDGGSVNVFVVDSKTAESTRHIRTVHDDMIPLIIQGDFGVQPTESENDVDDSVKSAGPPLHDVDPSTADKEPVREESATVSRADHVVDQPTVPPDDVFPATKPTKLAGEGGESLERVAGKWEPSMVEKASRRRLTVELSSSVVVDFYVGWFQRPWIAYLIVAVGAGLFAAATQADPAVLIVTVLIASAICCLFFPHQTMDDSADMADAK